MWVQCSSQLDSPDDIISTPSCYLSQTKIKAILSLQSYSLKLSLFFYLVSTIEIKRSLEDNNAV